MNKKVIKSPIKKSMDISKKSANKIINLIPGTLVYKGIKPDNLIVEKFEYNAEIFCRDTYDSIDEKFINDITENSKSRIKWFNITGINNVDELSRIGKNFDIDPMLLEQIIDVSKHSVYKISDKYIFNHVQMIYFVDGVIKYETLSIYLKDNTILTFQERKGDVFDSIRSRLEKNAGHIRNENSIYTYFCFLDALVDHYINVLEVMKKNIEIMELKLMENQLLDNKELHMLRKHILIIKLSTTPIEKLVQEILMLKECQVVEQKTYFESLNQHLKLTMHEISMLKESIDSLYENYMMTNANDMNQVMTILTIFSAIFIPLSFAASVFGMNFSFIPGVNNPLAFIYFLLGCGVTASLMLLVFKLKEWF